ncbi:MAG TPA: hypothetical protein VEC16_01730 [Alphaproteobacteria bacterium]|nr:hypothetical protein [Alphaproteobacteria bacterium]
MGGVDNYGIFDYNESGTKIYRIGSCSMLVLEEVTVYDYMKEDNSLLLSKSIKGIEELFDLPKKVVNQGIDVKLEVVSECGLMIFRNVKKLSFGDELMLSSRIYSSLSVFKDYKR